MQQAQHHISKDEIIRESAKAPRFLFRTWREGHNDSRAHDSEKCVTPTIFEDLGRLKPTIFEVPETELIQAAKSHINSTQDKSYFSSWTHSWRCLSSQINRHKRAADLRSMGDVHISIVDTKKLKKRGNLFLHSSFFSDRDSTIRDNPMEYLAFGIITGDAYRTVSLEQIIESNALKNISVGPWPHYTGLNEAIEVAVNLLSFPDDRVGKTWTSPHVPSLKRVLDVLSPFHIPKEWSTDISENQHATVDSNRAAFVLDHLIARRWGTTVPQLAAMDSVITRLSRIDISQPYATILNTGFPNTPDTASYCPSTATYTDVTITDDDEFVRDALLPPGKMDDASKKLLLQAQRKTPRYLFRGWRNSASRPSGGYAELNSVDSMIPLALSKRMVPQDKTIYDLNADELRVMTTSHPRGQQNINTEFPSWAASLQVALCFGSDWGFNHDCYISVVDTKTPNNQCSFVHVPGLSWLDSNKPMYKHEYLAHGVISGPALKAVHLTAFLDIGVPTSLMQRQLGIRPAEGFVSRSYPDITKTEVQRALSVARQYGGNFVVPVAVSILCLRQRDASLWQHGEIKGLSMIANELKDHIVPDDWCSDADILTDIVDPVGYGEVEQTIKLMRALLHYMHGKGARNRSSLFVRVN